MLDAGVDPAAVLRSIAGMRRADDDRVPSLGPRVAWVPTPPPTDRRGAADAALDAAALDADALPDWFATARGLTAAALLAPTDLPEHDA